MSMAEPGADYQVFLSFRGPDTRQGFTDCLYHFMIDAGIRVFRDNEEIRPGEKIDEILEAINNSIVCIPIFSKDYASSKWCLRELAEMVERKKKIMPVFYDVTPDDVKLKTCLYRDALNKHETEKEKEQWEKALKEVLEISGWESSRDKEEKALKEVVKMKGWELKHVGHGELCKSIVKEVLVNLEVKHKVVTDHLLGMHEPIETVLGYLDIQAPGVRFIGICGLGGSGKTTLAKVVFNHLSASFDACSFLANVRESSINDLERLQKKLICDLRGKYSVGVSDIDGGMKMIKDVCQNKKVFLVLDDVDSREQIKSLVGSSSWFSPGSRIIITTRDADLLAANHEGLERDQNIKEVWTYEMEEMSFEYALQLFCRHAFGMNFPPPEYLQLSRELVSASGQLPLTLEIIGSHLHGKSIGEWEDKRNSLVKIPPKDIQKKLMLSYESLDFRTKQIFLDIACFTNDLEKQNAVYMWRSCGLRPEIGLKELTSKSLVKFHDDKVWMHDHVRDLGREIICLKNFMDLGARSRLFNQKEAFGTIMRREGTRKIEVLHLSGDGNLENFSFTSEHFKNLPNLRYLSLGKLSLIGDFEHLFSKLRWLSWKCASTDFKATNINLEQLAVLDLSGSYISENWEGWNQIKLGDQLAVLDLSYCGISRTPDLSQLRSLERLILEQCDKLSEIDSSIGNLKRLKHLNLTGCGSLRWLPEEIGSLESLEEIFLQGSPIIQLPQSIGRLQNLKRLLLWGCDRLERLPETIGDAKSLLELDLSTTGISELPNSLGNSDKDALGTKLSLRDLNLSSCKIDRLPDLSRCVKLERLNISWCSSLKSIDSSIGKLKSLKHLRASSCTRLDRLPEEISSLETLEELLLSHCSQLSELPSTIGKLRRLKCLSLDFSGIQMLPEEIRDMESLTELDLSGTQITELPESFGGLKKLECLSMRSLRNFQKFPHSFGNLKSLSELHLSDHYFNYGSVSHGRVVELPDSFGGLEKVRHLSLTYCGIKKLPDSFGDLKLLSELDLSETLISELPDSFGGLTKLERLNLRCCGCIKKLPNSFGDLKLLRNLDLSKTLISELPDSFGGLTKLERLSLTSCDCIKKLPDSFGDLKLLRDLDPSKTLFSKLPDSFGDLKLLRELDLSESFISELPDSFGGLTELGYLYLRSCGCIKKLPNSFGDLKLLRELDLSETFISELPDSFGGLTKLERLNLRCCGCIKKLPNSFGELRSLSELDVSYSALKELPSFLADLKGLKVIKKEGCFLTRKMQHPEILEEVRELRID